MMIREVVSVYRRPHEKIMFNDLFNHDERDSTGTNKCIFDCGTEDENEAYIMKSRN